jgi:predicted sulfurtransferase
LKNGLRENDRGTDAMKRIIICVGVLFLLIMSYAAQAKAESENAAAVEDKVVAEAKKGGYQLITPEELKNEYLRDPASVLLVDTRQEWSYQMQHIEGALHIDFAPTWWNQYSPMMRSEMKKVLGPDKTKIFIFY